MRARTGASRAGLDRKLAAATAEVATLRARQSATARVLQAIATTPAQAGRALEMIAESACALCSAYDAVILLRRDNVLTFGAHHGPIPMDFAEFPITAGWTAGRSVVEKRPVHVDDLSIAADEFPDGAEMALRLGHRTTLSLPMLSGGEAIGSITLRRFEVKPFSDDEVALLATFADQAAIAIENARLFSELETRNRALAEALEWETATGEVLGTISRSATDLQPVLDTIISTAARLCAADMAGLLRRQGDEFRYVSKWGLGAGALEFLKGLPLAAGRGSAVGRVLLTGGTVQIEDALTDPEYTMHEVQARIGFRSMLAVPLLRADRIIGVLVLWRRIVRAFSAREIGLIETFADQAVIAIENARLFDELRESLQQQTATADVLKAISRSTFDLPVVLATLIEAAVRLCEADQGTIARERNGVFLRVASHGFSPEFMKAVLDKPVEVGRGSATGRALAEGRAVHIADVESDPDYTFAEAKSLGGFRTILAIPMLRDGSAIGVLALTRRERRPFTEKQVELLAGFADQAAIAIENVRLFEAVQARTRDVEEALAYQTATSEILRAISTSMTDARPVFEAIVQNAVSLCGSLFANVFHFDGEYLHFVASHNVGPDYVELLQEKYPMRPDLSQVSGRVVLTKAVVRVEDALSDTNYDQRFPSVMAWRRMLGVPMLSQDEPVGVIVVGWADAGPIPPRQEDLLRTFADQATIAIENARLFGELQARTRELTEALQQQTATGEVLSVISRSTTDLQPVLDSIASTAVRLCEANYTHIYKLADDGYYYLVAAKGVEESYSKPLFGTPVGPERGSLAGRAALEKRTVHIPNILEDPHYTLRIGKQRSGLGVPLLRQGVPIGVIVLLRTEIKPFTERQIELVTTFADQAVIAIENVRLFTELEARNRELSTALEQQTATSAILRVIASSPTDLKPVLRTVAENAARLCGADDAQIFRVQGDMLHLEASFGSIPIYFHEQKISREWVTGRSVVDGHTIHVHDLAAESEDEYPIGRAMQRRHGHHTTLATPLLKQGVVLGAILIRRIEIQPFSNEQIRLIETFADQAAIAIENARLFEALESALAEFNAVLDNIDYGVLFMDRDLRARIVNPALRRLWDIPQDILDRRPTVQELLEYNRDRGVYTTPPEKWDEWVAARVQRIRDGNIAPGEFTRADGKVYTYQCVSLPDGGRMLSYFDITELKNRQAELLKAKEAAETALAELRTAQERLVHTEKLASLGQLTAGIAHEIKNPLNFVNNFAALSSDLLADLKATLAAPIAALEAADRDEVEDLLRTARDNLGKIVHHGQRADSIVRNMLLHARHGSGEWRSADLNAIAEEALNLAYHGARAGHPDFNVEIAKHLDPEAGAIECCPQDIMRVILNLVSNGIYAANVKRASARPGFVPRIDLTTRAVECGVAMEVRDNGTGIPAGIRDSIFLPFFTTKPAGEGTGLGLSLSHDIVVKQHNGSFSVESEPGEFTCFRVVLPRRGDADGRTGA